MSYPGDDLALIPSWLTCGPGGIIYINETYKNSLAVI